VESGYLRTPYLWRLDEIFEEYKLFCLKTEIARAGIGEKQFLMKRGVTRIDVSGTEHKQISHPETPGGNPPD